MWGTPQIGFAVVVAVARRRQLQQRVAVQAQHGHTAAHVFRMAVFALPGEVRAHEAGELGARGAGVGCDQLPDLRNIRCAEGPSTVAPGAGFSGHGADRSIPRTGRRPAARRPSPPAAESHRCRTRDREGMPRTSRHACGRSSRGWRRCRGSGGRRRCGSSR